MVKPFRKIPQPAIDRLGRGSEYRPSRTGLVISLIGLVLITGGVLVTHRAENETVAVLPEWDLVLAARIGGIEYVVPSEPETATCPCDPKPAKTRKKPPKFCPT